MNCILLLFKNVIPFWTQLKHCSSSVHQVILAAPTGSNRTFTFPGSLLFASCEKSPSHPPLPFLALPRGRSIPAGHEKWVWCFFTKRSIAASQVIYTQTDKKQEEVAAKEGDRGIKRGERGVERKTTTRRKWWCTLTKKKKKQKNRCTHFYPEPKHRKQHSLQMSRLLTDESRSQTGSVPLKSDTWGCRQMSLLMRSDTVRESTLKYPKSAPVLI